MRILLQRVNSAAVDIAGTRVAQIGSGLLCFVCFSLGDERLDLQKIVEKILKLRIFRLEDKHFDQSLEAINGELLVVSQFTLAADYKKGLRPSFINSLSPDHAAGIYSNFIKSCKKNLGDRIQSGVFAADMNVSLVNNGPATFLLEF